METTLLLPGREDETAKSDPGLELFLKVDVKTARTVDGVSRGAGAVAFAPPAKDVDDDDIIEMEFENSGRRWKQWTTVGQLRNDFAQAGELSVSRDGKQELRIPFNWEASDKTRFGVTEIALKGLKVFGIDLDIQGKVIDKVAQPVATKAAAAVAAHFESQIKKQGHDFGLYRFDKLPNIGERITDANKLGGSEPYLLFIHGTASSSVGSFGKLAGQKEWNELRAHYPNRILALEHRTFSVSPIQNALDIAELLPENAILHIVTHSRGGLVGELLCLAGAGESLAKFDALTKFFTGEKDKELAAEREKQRRQLKQLWELLLKKKARVERFVRVACPARGTTLAAKRMDMLASAVINAIGFIPGVKQNPVAEFGYDLAKATLLALVKTKADPRHLPGIEAMVPTSPLVEFLNHADLTTEADLGVIAGDIEVGNLKMTIPALIGNSFFWAQNDLVVNTKSMSEGIRREGRAYCFFDQGAEVSHFNYFFNESTRRMMQRWLMREEGGAIAEFKEVARVARAARDGRVEKWLEEETKPVEQFEPYKLKVRVAHGDLRNAQHPIAVGHYNGDNIVGVEKYLDRLLGERLSKRHAMRIYPGPAGTAQVIDGPEGSVPSSVLVVGLGELGAISADTVSSGVMAAALRHALAVAEGSQKQRWTSAAISTLLIGTYGNNSLKVKDSVCAIISGVAQANRALQRQGLWNRVRIDQIELIELYEDCAIEAIHAVHDLSYDLPLDFPDQLTLEAAPRDLQNVGGGRYQRPVSKLETYKWNRVQISSPKPERAGREDGGGLEFVIFTERARSEAVVQATQRGLVDGLVASAVTTTRYDHKLSTTLYELLLPGELKEQSKDVLLLVDRESGAYPWELLADRSMPKPMAARIGILRNFRTAAFRANPVPSRGAYALVVGDTADSGLPVLLGAQAEAAAVAAKLQAGEYQPSTLVAASGRAIISELLAREYQILHIAAHGAFDADDPGNSGVVLGNGIFLSSKEFATLRTIPDLVFINCCHLGRMEQDGDARLATENPHRLAASVAEELIKMGVKAVIAAGWAVDDAAAEIFASSFYEQMLDGKAFGEAVFKARLKTFNVIPNTNTWGAYQCYGSPDFKLRLPAAQLAKPAVKHSSANFYYSRREYRDELKSIAERTGVDSLAEREKLAAKLKEMHELMPPRLRDGQVLADFGDAWRALGDFKQAIEFYQKAIERDDAKAEIGAIERLGNLECRYAVQLWKKSRASASKPGAAKKAGKQAGEAPREEFIKHLQDARERFDLLIQLKKTSERWSLIGKAYKNLALVADDKAERLSNLKLAVENYEKGYALSVENDEPAAQALLPGANVIACGMLLPGRKTEKLLAVADRCEKLLKAGGEEEKTIFLRIARPEIALLRHLIGGDVAKAQARLVRDYKAAFAAGASPREIESVLQQMDFLAEMLGAADRTPRERAMAASLHAIQEELKKLTQSL